MNGKNLSNKNVIQIKSRGVEYLQFRRFIEYEDKIEHCYSLRPLDYNMDNKDKTIDSYSKICKALKLDVEKIYRPKQTHSNNIKIVLDQEAGIYGEFTDVDGLITDKSNKILSLTYADCICLYFYDPVKNVIGNIHSGWRGTYQQIAKTAVKILKQKYGVKPEDLICRNSTKYKKMLL